MPTTAIEISQLNRSFLGKAERGVFDFSSTIKTGEVVCVLGPSGAGKSTLLRLLAGLEKPDSGLITRNSITSLPGNCVYVAQDYTLWPHLTVLENLILAAVTVKGIPQTKAEAEAHHLLKRFGLHEYAVAYPSTLSGGQKQRVALLRAIMMKPAVLLLDEITSALDPELTKSVLDMIRAFAKDGYTMVVVTHHIPLALAVADRIIFMRAGRIIQDLPALQFFHNQTDPAIISFIKAVSAKDHTVEIFEGVEQFQAYHLNLLKQLPENTTIYVAGSVGDRWYAPMGEQYQAYEATRVAKKITWKMAMYELGQKDKAVLQRFPALNEFRQLPRTLQNPANYNVMNGRVIIQIFGLKPTIMEIKDSAVAEAYLKFFEELWSVSKPC